MNVRLLHLVAVIGMSTVAASIGGVAATYWVIEDEVQDLLDDDLEAQSELLAQVLAAKGGLVSPAELEALIRPIFEEDQEETLWVNVYDPGNGRHVSNLQHALPLASFDSGPVSSTLHGYDWFGYQHSQPGGPVVQLLHRMDRYQEVREEVLEGAVLPALAVSLINLLLLVGLTYLYLGPLTRLARDLEGRRADSLAPVRVQPAAREIAVLEQALNGLMGDVDRVLTREREFASDVAHELRTPLTTLKLELASGSPDLESMQAEVERLVKLVTQLLTLARLQRTQWRESFEPVELDLLYSAQLSHLEGDLAEAGMQLTTDLSRTVVQGDATLLEILLGNLVGNVVRHCPAGTQVDVRLTATGAGTVLQVVDSGGGIETHRREQLNGGFPRLDRRGHGLGLGIAICRKIAEVHGATLTFLARSDGAPGLEVRVSFPPDNQA